MEESFSKKQKTVFFARLFSFFAIIVAVFFAGGVRMDGRVRVEVRGGLVCGGRCAVGGKRLVAPRPFAERGWGPLRGSGDAGAHGGEPAGAGGGDVGDFRPMSVWEGIVAKVESGERLSSEEGVYLFEKAELHQLGQLADEVRERKVGNRASYVVNRYLNYSNVCILSCQFCAFARKKREPGTFEHSVEELTETARKSVAEGITEIHIVGGLHPSLPYSFYLEMLRSLAALEPRPVLKVFLKEEGIGTLIQWGGRAIHQFPKLGFTQRLPKTDEFFKRCIMLPMNMSMTDDDLHYVCDQIIRFYKGKS